MKSKPAPKTYGLSEVAAARIWKAPALPYRPPFPKKYRPKIALVGCGGISAYHLRNYRDLGLAVAMVCDVDRARAEARAREFYPEAAVVTDYREILRRDDIEVVDVATHPAERVAVIEAALRARRHVLSQKPFVLDLATGRRLADLADAQGVKLAVNQNGRWAPHWSYLSQLVARGMLGTITSLDFTVAWDHSWVRTTPFNTLRHLVLYDFAVHWFDITARWMQGRPAAVFARVTAAREQPFHPPSLASVVADYGDAQVRWNFNAANRFAQVDQTRICGTRGTVVSEGPSLSQQTVTLTTPRGTANPRLEGTWFAEGFRGTMGELLRAIEEQREPVHGARGNLASLELTFAALASAHLGRVVKTGECRRLTGALLKDCRPSGVGS